MIYCGLSKHYLNTDARKAREYGQTAEELAAAAGFAHGRARALNLLGNAHLVMADYEKSMDHQYRALSIGKQINDTTVLVSSYINLGNVYHKIKDPARAERNYLQAAELARKIDDKRRLANAYNNLGNVHEEKGEYRQALSYYRRAAGIQERLKDKRGWAVSLLNVGNAYLLLGQPEKGLPYLFKSVRLNGEIGNNMIKMTCFGRIAEVYLAMGNKEEALRYARKSLNMAVKVGSTKKISEASQHMHAIYASMGNYKEAYRYFTIFTKQQEALNTESRAKIESEITARYETEQKELENQQLKADKEHQAIKIELQQRTLVLGGGVMLLLAALLGVLYVSRGRTRKAYTGLQEAHRHMEEQQTQILRQKNELHLQSVALKEQNVQLAQHSSFKNKVFSIISHDLRGPFASVKGILNMVQARTMPAVELQDILKLLGREIEVAGSMLDNVLVWAKAQLDESCVAQQPVSLHELAEEHIQLVAPFAERKSLRLINQITVDAVALADRERLNFVLRNLLMNAVKFSYAGGEVTLEAQEQGQATVISVRDRGKGISDGNITKLFSQRRFTTLGTSGEKGTGIGLMLCKELVESFGGSISVESRDGEGSVFFVSLQSATRVPKPEFA